jgi:hypothetical protein
MSGPPLLRTTTSPIFNSLILFFLNKHLRPSRS